MLTPLNAAMNRLADEHRRWLAAFDPQHLANWERMFKADDEAAMTEAGIRRMLQRHGVAVEPNERLTGICGGPDFRCSINRAHFYVEATCIRIATAEKHSGITEEGTGVLPFEDLTEAIFSECQSKARQCGNLDGPALVAIGTFHSTAAMACFDKALVSWVLTGKTKIAWGIDITTGKRLDDGHQTTDFCSAAFLRFDPAQEVRFALNSISAVLLCAVGVDPMRTLGIVHPNPARRFDPALLPNIEFCSAEFDRTSNLVRVNWSEEPPDGNRDGK